MAGKNSKNSASKTPTTPKPPVLTDAGKVTQAYRQVKEARDYRAEVQATIKRLEGEMRRDYLQKTVKPAKERVMAAKKTYLHLNATLLKMPDQVSGELDG
jgi:hypothetical protein